MRNQAYKLKLRVKWRIYFVFYIFLLEKDVTRRKTIDQKIADQFEFEKREQQEQKVYSIVDGMVFAKKTIDGRSFGLYYLIYWKRETYAEDTLEPVEGFAHLQ